MTKPAFPILWAFLLSTFTWHANAEENKTLADKFLEAAASEAGKRVMALIWDSAGEAIKNSSGNSWRPGSAHPRYPNVIASSSNNNWIPAPGYRWANPVEKNDWSVLSANSETGLTSANNAADLQRQIKSYRVIYGGADGVNLRSIPGGPEILATAFSTNSHIIASFSPAPYPAKGTDWVKVKLRGWMVRSGQRYRFLSDIDTENAFVSWNGNGDSRDNFVALRSEPSLNGSLLAKIYTGTSVKKTGQQDAESYSWNQVEIVGWMAVRVTIGRQQELLAEN